MKDCRRKQDVQRGGSSHWIRSSGLWPSPSFGQASRGNGNGGVPLLRWQLLHHSSFLFGRDRIFLGRVYQNGSAESVTTGSCDRDRKSCCERRPLFCDCRYLLLAHPVGHFFDHFRRAVFTVSCPKLAFHCDSRAANGISKTNTEAAQGVGPSIWFLWTCLCAHVLLVPTSCQHPHVETWYGRMEAD